MKPKNKTNKLTMKTLTLTLLTILTISCTSKHDIYKNSACACNELINYANA